MALIVEDGTGLEDADSYISLAEANAYATNYGLTNWNAEADDTVKEVALRLATQFIDLNQFVSEKLNDDQSLEFPRYDSLIGFPQKVKNATIELAEIHLSGVDLMETPEIISQISVGVGGGAVQESKSYASPKVLDSTRKALLMIKNYMESSINGGFSTAKILRS